jgi:penicillin V acylase-like amidase (Ntn superfamily)
MGAGMRKLALNLLLGAALCLPSLDADACTRILYETGNKTYIVGRTMDWAVDPHTDPWSFPKGMRRDGGVGPQSIQWSSKYGSVIAAFENVAAVDGMNEARPVANALYLVEADCGDAKASAKPAPAKLELEERPIRAGGASGKFPPAQPFKFLSY